MSPHAGRVGVAIRHGTDPAFVNQVAIAAVSAARHIGVDAMVVGAPADVREVETLVLVGRPEHQLVLLDGWRPSRIISWYTEPLPRAAVELGFGDRVLRGIPSGHILGTAAKLLPPLMDSARFRDWRERSAWQRDLVRNRRQLLALWDRFDEVVVTDDQRAAALDEVGKDVRAVPIGYHPALAGPIVDAADGVRDIDVFFFGRQLMPGRRRHKYLAMLREQLAPEFSITMPEAWLEGPARDALLARARVVIDVHRVPGSFSPERHVLATAAGAAFVTEALPQQPPFVAGTHHLEVPIEAMADAVRGLLADEDRRRELVRASQALLLGPLDMRASMRAILRLSGDGPATVR